MLNQLSLSLLLLSSALAADSKHDSLRGARHTVDKLKAKLETYRAGPRHLKDASDLYLELGGQVEQPPEGVAVWEKHPCVPFESATQDQVNDIYGVGDESCLTNSCSDGCCRAYTWMVCDSMEFPHVACFCNENTKDPNSWPAANPSPQNDFVNSVQSPNDNSNVPPANNNPSPQINTNFGSTNTNNNVGSTNTMSQSTTNMTMYGNATMQGNATQNVTGFELPNGNTIQVPNYVGTRAPNVYLNGAAVSVQTGAPIIVAAPPLEQQTTGAFTGGTTTEDSKSKTKKSSSSD